MSNPEIEAKVKTNFPQKIHTSTLQTGASDLVLYDLKINVILFH